MTRYVTLTKPPAQWTYSEWGEPHPTMQVIDDGRAPEPTGLLDEHGVLLYRLLEAIPFGFRGKSKP